MAEVAEMKEAEAKVDGNESLGGAVIRCVGRRQMLRKCFRKPTYKA